MKLLISIAFFVFSISAFGQSKETIKILANARLLEQTVFITKDSAVLEELCAKNLHYKDVDGQILTKEAAIKSISQNASVYVKSVEPRPYNVSFEGDSAIVKQIFAGTEKKADGGDATLNLSILEVWVKEKKDWKLVRFEITEN